MNPQTSHVATLPTAALTTAVTTPAPPSSRFPLLAAFAVPAYTLFWTAGILIGASDGLRTVALASLALDLTYRPSGLASLQTLSAITSVLMLLFGGLAADRFRPHRALLAAMLVTALAAALLAAVPLFGPLAYWHLVSFVLVGGLAGGLRSVAHFCTIPDLLPDRHLRAGNAVASMTRALLSFVIPPLAGLAVAAAGAPPTLALGSATSLAAAAILVRIRLPQHPTIVAAAPDSRAATSSLLSPLREGLRAARADGAVWVLIWASAILVPGSIAATTVGVPALARLTLDAGDAGIGLLLGALGAGGFAGAFAAGAVRSVRHPGLVAALSIAAEGMSLIGAGLAPALWLAAAALTAAGFFGTVRVILANTIIQTRTAPAFRGRVTAIAMLSAIGPQTFTLTATGYVGDLLGPRSILLIGGSLVILGGAIVASRRTIRTLTLTA